MRTLPKVSLKPVLKLIIAAGAIMLLIVLWRHDQSVPKRLVVATPSPSTKVAATSAHPNATNCVTQSGDIAIIYVETTGLTPSCLIVTSTQHLNVINDLEDTDGTISFAGLDMKLGHEGTVEIPYTFTNYLQHGVHLLQASFDGGTTAEIWYK